MAYYESKNEDFVHHLKIHNKMMYLFTNNADKDQKNNDRLVEMSHEKIFPVARLKCWHDNNKLQSRKQQPSIMSHFE